MQSRKTVKWSVLVLLLVLVMAAASPGTPFAQEPQFEPMVPCGDSASCSMASEAFSITNSGTGAAVFGYNTSGISGAGVYGRGTAGAGVRGRSQSGNGVFGASYNTAGVRARSTNGVGLRAEGVNNYAIYGFSNEYRGAYLRSGADSYPDLVLGANGPTSDNGTISSEPSDTDSDLVFYGMDKVQIHLDEDNNTEGENFRIYNGANAVALELADNGEMYIADDLHLDTDGGFGEIYATGASNSRLYLISNSWVDVTLDDNNDEAVTCFNIFGSSGLLWQVCESKGTTAVGSQAVAVETSSGTREMYTIGSPGLWFEDFGSAALVDGQARVEIDAIFAETVNLDVDYQVYLTPVSSEAILLFVTEKTPTAFTVQGVTLDGRPASASFDYRIVAKRLNYETQRLEQVDLTAAVAAEP